MAKEKKKPETPEEKQKREDENRNLLVMLAGFNDSRVNQWIGLEEEEKEAQQIADRVENRKKADKAKADAEAEQARLQRLADGKYETKAENRGLKSPDEIVKGAKHGIFGADARATAPWESLTGLGGVPGSTSLSKYVDDKDEKDPYSYQHMLGSEKSWAIAMDAIDPYLSKKGKKLLAALKGSGIGQFGKDSAGKEYSKDELELFDLFYTAATDPGDIMRPLDKVYDKLKTLGGMTAVAKILKPFLSKDGGKLVDALTALDFGKDDPTGMAQLLRDLLHGDRNAKDWPAKAFENFGDSLLSGPGLSALMQAMKPFLGKDWGRAIDGLKNAGFGTDKDLLGLYPALEHLFEEGYDGSRILGDLWRNVTSADGFCALLQGLIPFLPKKGAIWAKALTELIQKDVSDALSVLTALLPKGAQLPAKALLALLKNDFNGLLLSLVEKFLPKELQQTFQIFMQMGGLKGIFGLELPTPKELLGIADDGALGAGASEAVIGCAGGPIAARVKDLVTSKGSGELLPPDQDSVLIGNELAARITDPAKCKLGPDTVAYGEPSVLIKGKAAARRNDPMAAGGVISTGWESVMIGAAPPPASSTVATSSGAAAAASSAGTAAGALSGGGGGGEGGGSAGGGGGEPGGGPGGSGAADGKKKPDSEYDLGADGRDKLQYPGPEEPTPEPQSEGGDDKDKEEDKGEDDYKLDPDPKLKVDDPSDAWQKLQKELVNAGEKGIEAKLSLEGKDAVKAATDKATDARSDADVAKQKAEAARQKEKLAKQGLDEKIADLKSDQKGAFINHGDSLEAGGNREDRAASLKEGQDKLAEETKVVKDAEDSTKTRVDAETKAGKLDTIATDLELKAKTLSNLDLVKNVLNTAGKGLTFVGYTDSINDAINPNPAKDPQSDLNTAERILVYIAAEATPDLTIGAVSLLTGPFAPSVAVGMSSAWAITEYRSGNAGQQLLRQKYTDLYQDSDFRRGTQVVAGTVNQIYDGVNQKANAIRGGVSDAYDGFNSWLGSLRP